MFKKYHFISGLPRSGSTLLSAILKQNPKFTANISDPLQGYVHSIIKETSTAVGMEAAVPIEKRKQLIKGLFDNFYKDGNEVCFNTSRGWSSDTALLNDIFPDFKMIVCLREIPWILDSFEQLQDKNPFTIKPLYHHQDTNNVYERSNILMGNVPNLAGYVSGPLTNVKHSMFCNEKRKLLYVEYDTLVKDPLGTMKQIYDFLEEEWYEHDFDNVEDSYDEFDSQAKIKGLHTVRRKIEYMSRQSILPPDIWQQYGPTSFWLADDFNQIKRTLNWVYPRPIASQKPIQQKQQTLSTPAIAKPTGINPALLPKRQL
jgi:sulfotransferase